MLAGIAALALSGLPGGSLAQDGPQRLLAFGDSLTQGYGLPQGDGLVPQLEAWLRAQGRDVEVVNAGVSGDTTKGGLSRIDWALQDDVDAVMVILGANDMLRGLAPARTRANLDGILDAIDARGLPAMLVGLHAPTNYGAEYKRDFDAIFPDLAEAHGALYVESFFAPLMGDPDAPDPAAARGLMQADGLHPNAEGVARVVEALGPEVVEILDRARNGGG